MKNELATARQIIADNFSQAGYKVETIYLFGSRAKNTASANSDWDFFVVLEKDIDRYERSNIILQIKRKLSALKIPNDIIAQSKSQVDIDKDNLGRITYYALKEGVPV